jgi:prenyl protein peptidase
MMEVTLYEQTEETVPLVRSLVYCMVCATSFVLSLYVIVPSHVRRLDRDDALQIKWRTAATLTVCAIALAVYPRVFPVSPRRVLLTSLLWDQGNACARVLLHSALLFFGPLVLLLPTRRYNNNSYSYRKPNWNWITIRNLVVAPLTEEIVFRGCIVSALDQTSLSTITISWVAPLFFGCAHVHHLFRSIQAGSSVKVALLQTTFQFAYTSLFGSYVSFAYLQTRSILAITLCHSFCNVMGLPSLIFRDRTSLLAHVAGMVAFAMSFNLFLFKQRS